MVVIILSKNQKKKRMKTKSSDLKKKETRKKQNAVLCLFPHISSITETFIHVSFYSTIISSAVCHGNAFLIYFTKVLL